MLVVVDAVKVTFIVSFTSDVVKFVGALTVKLYLFTPIFKN